MKIQIKFMIVSAGMFLASFAWAVPPATPTLYVSPDGAQVHFYWDEVPGASGVLKVHQTWRFENAVFSSSLLF